MRSALITCDIFFDLMNLADGVVSSEHVEVEGLRVFADTGPRADVRCGPSASANTPWSERDADEAGAGSCSYRRNKRTFLVWLMSYKHHDLY